MTAPSVVIVDEQGLSLDELAVACGLETQWIITLVDADILPMTAEDPSAWRFQSTHLSRARRAFRLHRDFDASLTAVTVMDTVAGAEVNVPSLTVKVNESDPL